LRQVMHRLFVFHSLRGDVPLPVLASRSRPGRGNHRWQSNATRHAFRRRSWGFALRSVAPARGSSRRLSSRYPHMPLDEQPASIGSTSFSSRDRLARLDGTDWRPSAAPSRSGPFTAASGYSGHGQSVPADPGS
jgi:hypothetical protein